MRFMVIETFEDGKTSLVYQRFRETSRTLPDGLTYIDRETHNPHDRDEVYVGIDGRGRLTADGEDFGVEAGAIVYVKAGVEHYFHDVTDDLTVLVFFAGGQEETSDR